MKPPLAVIEELIRRFSKVVQLSMEDVRADTEAWMTTAVVAKSLGRRVEVEAAIQEFRAWTGIKGEVVGFILDQGHLLFHFADEGEREAILGSSWVVAG